MKHIKIIFGVIIILWLILFAKIVYGYDQRVIPDGGLLIEQEELDKEKQKIIDASSEYYSYGDMYATAKFKVTKKKDKSGGITYLLGEDNSTIEWKQAGNMIFDDDENSDKEGTWYVWLDIYYELNISTEDKYDAKAQNSYSDKEGDFDPQKDGWEGQRALDSVIKKGVDAVSKAVEVAKVVTDWVAKFLKNVWGTIISTIMDFFGMAGDGIQWLANTIQTDEGNKVLYSYKYLSSDKAAAKKKNLYTNVGKYEEGAKAVTGIDVKKDGNDDGEDDFTKKTKIPVMVGDLYNIAVGHLDFLDADFLTGSDATRPDGTLKHEEGSAWIILRDFAATIIHICIYIASAFLIISLIWFGIKILKTSLDNPRARAEYKEGLEKFEKSLLMLIGSIIIMALCIFGTKAFYSSIEDDNYELPIRVNVEDTYSFSTTAAGYVRYMSLTDDVNEWLQKTVCTMTYLLLALVNLVAVIIMMARVLVLWILSMAGPIIAAMNVFRKENEFRFGFGTWAEMYVAVSFIQVVIAFIYKVILAIIV